MTLASLFVDTTSSSIFFDVVLILLWSLVIDSNFMLVSLLVLELWQFSLIRDWLEIPEIANTPIWVLPNIEDWGELEIPNLVQMFLMECYWMLVNARTTACTVIELLVENQQGWGRLPPSPPPRLKLKPLTILQKDPS